MEKLIVIRGPSASGKSTVAQKLLELASKPTAFIQQDPYRFMFKPVGYGKNSAAIHKMIEANICIALDEGYDVITEGIYTMKAYRSVFEQIIKHHPKHNYMYFMDVSFEETLRRHDSKPDTTWGEEQMREWYAPHDYSGFDFETIVPESSGLDETVALIHEQTQL